MTYTRLDFHSVPGSPLCSWKTRHLPLASPLPLLLVFKGPCLGPVWVSSNPATVRDKCDVRVCWIQGIYVKHMHRDKDVPPGTFGFVFFVQEQRCCCVPRWCDHQNDVKRQNYFFTAVQPRPQHTVAFLLHFWKMGICRGPCFYQTKLTVNKCHFLTASVVTG